VDRTPGGEVHTEAELADGQHVEGEEVQCGVERTLATMNERVEQGAGRS
jgi:hypothetical protein